MREQLKLKKNRVLLSLPFILSSLLLVVLLCGLARATEAGPGVSSAAVAWERNDPSLLDYQTGVFVCEQSHNLVPDPVFDEGIGRYTHWHCEGECKFRADQPGHDSDPSAVIFERLGEGECRLVTPVDEIYVEHDRWYEYRAWLKTGPLEGNAFLRIRFYKWEDGWQAIHPYPETNSVTDTRGAWVRVTGSAQAPRDAQYARVEAVLPASSVGSVWVDDVFFGLATCLDISKYDEPDPVLPGEMLTYTIVYSNIGREKATNVEIIDTYDEYVNFRWADPDPFTRTKGTWKVPHLFPGISGTITVVVQVEDNTGDREELINWFQINSDKNENEEPICRFITTTITGTHPNGCDIVLHPPEAEQAVKPGDAVHYDLKLHNAGSCDGEARLAHISSQGWDVDITPEEFIMPSGRYTEVTVSISVPLHASYDAVDHTLITATLTCGPNNTATATATVTTRVAVPPTKVVISGPTTGHVNTSYIFTAIVSPPTATQPIEHSWWPPPLTGQGSAVVTYTWSTTGTKTITVTATNVGGAVTDTHVITITLPLYLPLILNCWPCILGEPMLYSIGNVDIDGDYQVCWSTNCAAEYYVLEEATDSAFTDAKKVYTGLDSCYPVSEKGAGWYYYRVKMCCDGQCSGWSNVRRVGTWWEHEPNNSCPQANGPIISGLIYSGTLPSTADREDYFYFDMTTTHSVELWLNDIPRGCDYDLYLYDDVSCAEWDNCHSHKSGDLDEHILCKDVPAGRYHARLHGYWPGSSSPYHLRVVYR